MCLALLVIVLIASGCNPTAAPTSQASQTAAAGTAAPGAGAVATFTPAPAAGETPTLVPLTYEFMRNMRYFEPYSNKAVKLVDGSYQDGSGATYLSIKLSDVFAIGDLNGDGVNDAVAILAENTGGSGVFISLVVMMYINGQPAQIAMEIGDREQVKAMAIKDQLLTLNMVVHQPNDSACCPSLPKIETYILTTYGLILVHTTTQTPSGAVRSITIANPASGAAVGDAVQVKGSVTIAPLENSLAYHLSDASGNLITEGLLSVTAANVGGSGTFDSAIDLSKITSGTNFRLDILDLSAADGSVLDMDSVALTHQ
jgi:hypothetical protein